VTANPTERISYTFEQKVKLGQQAAAEIEKKLTLVPADDPASQYINDPGQKLASAAPRYKFPYTFKIVRETGAEVYLQLGLLTIRCLASRSCFSRSFN
jgi:predicted Zn-dependent protease